MMTDSRSMSEKAFGKGRKSPVCDSSTDSRSMSDSISRKDAINALMKEWYHCQADRKTAVQAIKALPSTDKPIGKWLKAVNEKICYTDADAKCDQCHKVQFNGWGMKFCPNCGAKMEVEYNERFGK